MMFDAPHAPAWQPYADAVLRRLNQSLSLDDPLALDGQTRPPVYKTAPPQSSEPADIAKTEDDTSGCYLLDFLDETGRLPVPQDAEALRHAPLAGRVPTPVQVSLALRLAATFGTEAAFRRCLEPGAVTVLGGMRQAESREIAEVLRLAFLPPGRKIATHVAPGMASVPHWRADILCIGPKLTDASATRSEIGAFHRQIAAALELPTPAVLLMPEEVPPPQAVARHLPAPLLLTPLGREIALSHLRFAYTGDVSAGDVSALAASVPADAWSGLTDTALHLALRAPTVTGAMKRLCEALTAGTARDGEPRLEDMAGESEALSAARQLVADLDLWRQKRIGWSDLCHSMLLHGQPGTGKTWLARAMGCSAGLGFVATSFAEWQACGHLGDMLRAMHESFAEARRQAPAILFIDEIDAVGSRESDDAQHRSYRAQVINGFLEQMDGIGRQEGVIVIGACNHPDRIDPAVLRAGRFDLKVEVPLPDTAAIAGILRRHLGAGFDAGALQDLARMATGDSAAEVDAKLRKARARARSEKRDLSLCDLQAQFGQRGPRAAALERRAAVHECGHALICAARGPGEVTRVMLTRDGGYTSRRGVPPTGLPQDIADELCVLMAGRAAESLVFGDISTGAGGAEDSDLAQATELAVAIDTRFGLGVHGPLWLDLPPDMALRDPEIRRLVRTRIEEAETRAGEILARHRDHLDAMAERLAHDRLLAGEALGIWLAPVQDASGAKCTG